MKEKRNLLAGANWATAFIIIQIISILVVIFSSIHTSLHRGNTTFNFNLNWLNLSINVIVLFASILAYYYFISKYNSIGDAPILDRSRIVSLHKELELGLITEYTYQNEKAGYIKQYNKELLEDRDCEIDNISTGLKQDLMWLKGKAITEAQEEHDKKINEVKEKYSKRLLDL